MAAEEASLRSILSIAKSHCKCDGARRRSRPRAAVACRSPNGCRGAWQRARSVDHGSALGGRFANRPFYK